jgi:hypothetical protein
VAAVTGRHQPARASPPSPSPGPAPGPPAGPGRPGASALASAVLLLAALGALALGMLTVTFNPVLVTELEQMGQRLPAACLDGGIATYSGAALAFGTAPGVDTACLAHLERGAGDAAAGVQLPVLAAALLMAGGVAAALGGWRWSGAAGLVLAAAAAAVLGAEALGFSGAFESRFLGGADAVAVQPAIGLWVVLALLGCACLAAAGPATARWVRRALAPLEEPGRARA